MKNPIPSEFVQKLAPAFGNFYEALFEPEADYKTLLSEVMKSVDAFSLFANVANLKDFLSNELSNSKADSES